MKNLQVKKMTKMLKEQQDQYLSTKRAIKEECEKRGS